MIDLQTTLALINLGGLIIAIIQLYRQRKDTEHLARVTNNLEQELHRLNVELDQDIQRLLRARDATIERHKAAIYLAEFDRRKHELPVESPRFPPEQYLLKFAEYSAHWAELRGLAFAIDDAKLIALAGEGAMGGYVEDNPSIPSFDELRTRGQSQKIHTRISQLISEATKEKGSSA